MIEEQNIDWIKELVRSEEQMEKAGLVDFTARVDKENLVLAESIEFLKELKRGFIKNARIFNELRSNEEGAIKVYGIAKTHADFLLFRKGYKLVFNLVQTGKIEVSFHYMSQPFMDKESSKSKKENSPIPDSLIEAAWAAFDEVRWVSSGKPVNKEYLVKYYLRNFVQNSAQ